MVRGMRGPILPASPPTIGDSTASTSGKGSSAAPAAVAE